DDFEISRAGADTGRIPGSKLSGEFPEQAVHGHQVVRAAGRAYVAYTWPFGIPSVRPVVAVAGFWQAVERPFPRIAYAQHNGFVVPAGSPDRVGFGVGIPVDAAGAGHFHKLV